MKPIGCHHHPRRAANRRSLRRYMRGVKKPWQASHWRELDESSSGRAAEKQWERRIVREDLFAGEGFGVTGVQ